MKTRVPLQRIYFSAAAFIDGQVHALENRFGAEVGGYSLANLMWHLLSEHQIVAVIEDGSVQSPEEVYGRETYSLSKWVYPN